MKKVKEIVLSALEKFWAGLKTKVVLKANIINNLTSTSTDAPLSANQGKVLKGEVDSLNENISSHTHRYAASASAGGSANSAVKLDTSAGSATQPVYFNGGKPVVCIHKLEKSVPANAVFTDTLPAYTAGSGTINTTYVSNGWVKYFKYGRVVCIKAWLSLKSNVSNQFSGYIVASGLPNSVDDVMFIGTANIDDAYSNTPVQVTNKGQLELSVKSNPPTSKTLVISGVYISAT